MKPARKVVRTRRRRFDFRLTKDPRYLRRIAQARRSLRAGRGVRLEAL